MSESLFQESIKLANLMENMVMLEGEVKFYNEREDFLHETSKMLNSRTSFNQYYFASVDYSHDKENYVLYAHKKKGENKNA